MVNEEFEDGMEFIGCGAYSIVFKKGNKVIKVSFSEEEDISYNCDSILKFNDTRNEKLENGISILTIGSQNLANCNWYENLSEDEINLKMYEVFCNARNSGYIIADIKKQNLGIIDNQLKVIDGGFIYEEKDFDINKINSLVPLTSKPTFEYFMKLYDEGYRLNENNELEQTEKRI